MTDDWWLMPDYWWLMPDDWWLMIDYWLSSHGKCGGHGGPQADEVGEQQLSKIGQQLKEKNIYPQMTRRDTEDDYWWLMTDYWLSSHGKCGWHGCPQADEGGERKLKRINRELKEMGPQADGRVNSNCHQLDSNWKKNIFLNCRYIAGNCCSRKRVGGLWSAIAINDQQLKENIYIDGHRWRSASGLCGRTWIIGI